LWEKRKEKAPVGGKEPALSPGGEAGHLSKKKRKVKQATHSTSGGLITIRGKKGGGFKRINGNHLEEIVGAPKRKRGRIRIEPEKKKADQEY